MIGFKMAQRGAADLVDAIGEVTPPAFRLPEWCAWVALAALPVMVAAIVWLSL
jgi:hypothetical protein